MQTLIHCVKYDNYEPTELMKERNVKAKPMNAWDKVTAWPVR